MILRAETIRKSILSMMKKNDRNHVILWALGFELGLGWLGWFLARWLEIPLGSQIDPTWPALFQGLAATVPMFGLLVIFSRSSWPPLVELRRQVEQLLGMLFRHCGLGEMALLALGAGVGEELLFRGVLQPFFGSWTSPEVAVLLAGLLFGLAHAVSATYFVLASLAGMYMGWLAWTCGNLVPPMLAHGLYDFLALWYLRRLKEQKAEG